MFNRGHPRSSARRPRRSASSSIPHIYIYIYIYICIERERDDHDMMLILILILIRILILTIVVTQILIIIMIIIIIIIIVIIIIMIMIMIVLISIFIICPARDSTQNQRTPWSLPKCSRRGQQIPGVRIPTEPVNNPTSPNGCKIWRSLSDDGECNRVDGCGRLRLVVRTFELIIRGDLMSMPILNDEYMWFRA